MADQNRTLQINVDLDTKKFNKQTKGVEKRLGGVAKVAKSLGPLLAASFGAAIFKKSIDSFIRQEKAIAQLEARIKSTGSAAGVTSSEMISLAVSLQQVTTFGDEAIIEMQSLLLTFTKIGGDVLPDTTEAVLNVATAMGTDLQSAAIQVGKALNDPAGQLTALSRSGIQFSDAQKTLIKDLVETNRVADAQKIILGELSTQFGGAARAAKDTLGGALDSLNNAFGDALENLGAGGKGFVPLIQSLEKLVTSKAFTGGMELMADHLSDMGWALGVISGKLDSGSGLIDFVSKYSDQIKAALPGLREFQILSNLRDASEAGGNQKIGTDTPGFDLYQNRPQRSSLGNTQDDLAAKQELDEIELSMLVAQAGLIKDVWMSTNEESVQMQLTSDALMKESKRALVNDTLGLLNVLGARSKKWALAGLVISKGVALADTWVSGIAASQAALAPPPLGLGPVAGAGLSASLLAQTKIRMGLIAATGLLQAGSVGGGGGGAGGGGAVNTGGSGVSGGQGIPTQPVAAVPNFNAPQIKVISGGTLIGKIVEEEVMPAINDALRRGVSLDLEFN